MSARTPGAVDDDGQPPPSATTTGTADPLPAGTTRRVAHRHHHTPGHSRFHPILAADARGGSRSRRHHHHHHHHNGHVDQPRVREDAGWENDERAPYSATFGTFAPEEEQQQQQHLGGPRTAPLAGATGTANSRNLLSVEQPQGPPSRQHTPAPSYHSDSPVVTPAARRPSDTTTATSTGDYGYATGAHLAAPERAAMAASPRRAGALGGYNPPKSPHVHFLRSRSNTSVSNLSSTDAGFVSGEDPAQHTMRGQLDRHDRPARSPRRADHTAVPVRTPRGGQRESLASSVGGLQERDQRFSVMVQDLYDPRRRGSADDERALRKRTSAAQQNVGSPLANMMDSMMGFDEMTPSDLLYSEGSKIDGGFGFAIPSRARESTILLDSRHDISTTSLGSSTGPPAAASDRSRFSVDSATSFASSLSNFFLRRGSNASVQQIAASPQLQARDSTTTGFSRGIRPNTLSNRVTNSNLRPSQLNLGNRRPSRLRESTTTSETTESDIQEREYAQDSTTISSSTWEDVQLSTGGGKNDRIADALGVRRTATRSHPLSRDSTASSELTMIKEEGSDGRSSTYTMSDRGIDSGGAYYTNRDTMNVDPNGNRARDTMGSYAYASESEVHERNPRFISGASDADGYRATMNLPPGVSQADIVAICLVQGMVPPGLPPDASLVTWSGPLSPTNPRNWSPWVKWYACILVSWSTFLANAATNMIAPALGLMSSTYKELYTMTIRGALIGCYIFAFTFAPLLFGPMSEIMGRKPVLCMGISLFFLASLLSGFVTAVWQLMILRFLAALGAGAPLAIGGAVLTDIFSPDQRGRAMTVFALAPQLGPVLGPIMGGWVTQEVQNWRWIFWICAICVFTAAAPMAFMRESYTPQILARRGARMRKETGNSQLTTIFERRKETVRQIFTRGAVRPMILFSCEPIVQLLTLYVSLIYGIIHLLVATFPAVFGTIYGEYPGWASMHFMCIGIGTITGGFAGGYLVEKHYHSLSLGNRGVAKPEFKLYCMLYTVWIPPLGLMIYGVITWFGIHWIFADLGIVTFCFGISVAVVAIQSYIVDCYALLAGSALTATIVVRSIVGTGATIGAEDLLLHAGMLWSNVALASACIFLGAPAAYAVYFYGATMRQKSRHATHKR